MDDQHSHTHESTQLIINRLAKAIGHLQKVKKMVEEGRDCSDILVQTAAVKSAVNNIGKIILQDHLHHCVAEAVETGDLKVLDDFSRSVLQYLK